MSKNDRFNEELTSVIIDKIKNIEKNYEDPWFSNKAQIATNLSGRPYTGGNQLLLSFCVERAGWELPTFMTFNSAKKAGISIKKGSKSIPIQYFNRVVSNIDTKEKISFEEYNNLSSEKQKEYNVRIIRSIASVFNVAQTNMQEVKPELYNSLQEQYKAKTREIDANKGNRIDQLVKDNSWLCPIYLDKIDEAYFDIKNNEIHSPSKEKFKSDESYYSTLLHEMTHSTGHSSLLNRLDVVNDFKENYAKEELIAELGAAITGIYYGVSKTISDNNTAYLKGWLKAIEKEPEFLYSVVSDASKASNVIIEHVDKVTQEQTKNIETMEDTKLIDQVTPLISMYSTPQNMSVDKLANSKEEAPIELVEKLKERDNLMGELILNSDVQKEKELLREKYNIEQQIREQIRNYILVTHNIVLPPTFSMNEKIKAISHHLQTPPSDVSQEVMISKAETDSVMVTDKCKDTEENRAFLAAVDAEYEILPNGELSYKTQLRVKEAYEAEDTEKNRKYLKENDIPYTVKGNKILFEAKNQKLALLLVSGFLFHPIISIMLVYAQNRYKLMDNLLKDKQFTKEEANRLNKGETIVKKTTENGKEVDKIYWIDNQTNKLSSLYAKDYHIPRRVNGVELSPNQIKNLINGNAISGYDEKIHQHYEMKLDANEKYGVKSGFKDMKADKEFSYVPTPNSPTADKVRYVQIHGAQGVNDIWDRGGVNIERDSFLDQYDIEGFYKDYLKGGLSKDEKQEESASKEIQEALDVDISRGIKR